MNENCICVCACVCLYVRVCVRKREREHVCVRERESMCVLEIVREYFSTILQAFVVCSCFIVIETHRFVDKFEDIVKDFLFSSKLKSSDPCKRVIQR